MNTIVKWLIFNSVTTFVAIFLIQFYDAFNKLLILDHTYVTFVILGIYIVVSGYIGIFRERANLEIIRFNANMLPLIGMAGTLIAVMTVLNQAQQNNATSLAEFHGLYAIFITTLFGVVFMGLAKYQAAMVLGDYKDA